MTETPTDVATLLAKRQMTPPANDIASTVAWWIRATWGFGLRVVPMSSQAALPLRPETRQASGSLTHVARRSASSGRRSHRCLHQLQRP
jgi:hypothetical protein